MAKRSIEEQIEALRARWELASRINSQVFIGGWPEGRNHVHLPYRVNAALEEFRDEAGGSFYVERGELVFITLDEMESNQIESDRDALLTLIQRYREAGHSVARLEALLEVDI